MGDQVSSSELVLGAQFLRFSPECYHGKAQSSKRNGSTGLETRSPGLARWGECDITGAPHCHWRGRQLEDHGSHPSFEDDSRSA